MKSNNSNLNSRKSTNPQMIKTFSFSIIENPNLKRNSKKNIKSTKPIHYQKRNILLKNQNKTKRPKSSTNSSKNKLYYDNSTFIQPKISQKEQDLVFNALYNDSIVRKEKLRNLSKERENQLNSIYTFCPIQIPNKFNERYNRKLIKSYSRLNINNVTNNDNLNYYYQNNNFYNRLDMYNRKKKENLEKIKNDIYEIIPHPKNIKMNSKDFQLPYNSQKFIDFKNQKIERLREELLHESGITFKPKLNENVNAYITNTFYQRNEAFQKSREIKLNNVYEDNECTFSPKINYESSLIQFNSNVGNRLYNYQKFYKKNLDYIREKNEKFYPFKPKISKNTYSILENRKKNIRYIKEHPYFQENFDTIIHESKDYSESIRKINLLTEKQKGKSESKQKVNQKKIIQSCDNENKLNNNIEFEINERKKRNFNENNLGYKYFSNGNKIEEKERPTTNCSSNNSKSIVNLNYYENLI